MFQRWTGESNPASYPGTPADFWFTEGSDILTATQVKTLYESNAETNALTDDKLQILDFLSLDPSGDIRSSRTFIFPPGSVIIGDSVIESGGRMISAKSLATGNQGAFLIQLFSGTQYSKATVYGSTQVAALFDVQVAETSETSGTTITTMRQVVQNAVQLQRVRFMPEGGTITQSFEFTVRLTETGEPIYNETVNPSDTNLTNLGSGVWELELLNPSQFDAGFDAYISVTGLSLLGGNGFDGTDGVRFGDATKSNFFMWLRTFSIPIVRQNIATEDFVLAQMGGAVSIHGFSINIPSRVDLNTNLNVNTRLDFNVTNFGAITSIELQLDGVNIATLTNPTIDGVQSQNVDLTGIDTSADRTLVFRIQANGSVNSNSDSVSVRNILPQESVYYGLSDSNNPSTIPTGDLSQSEAVTGSQSISSGLATSGQYFIILVPTDHDITAIEDTVLNNPVLSIFSKVENIRVIGSVNYNSYVVGPLNAGFNESYIITLN